MAKRETLEQFAKNLHKFSPIIIKRIIRDWNTFTSNAWAGSQDRVPLLTGRLQDSGEFKEAKITSKGIESSIVYTQPYAVMIETGERNGKKIKLREVGTTVKIYRKGSSPGTATKQRKGEIGFLSKAIDADTSNVEQDIFKSIETAWELI